MVLIDKVICNCPNTYDKVLRAKKMYSFFRSIVKYEKITLVKGISHGSRNLELDIKPGIEDKPKCDIPSLQKPGNMRVYRKVL